MTSLFILLILCAFSPKLEAEESPSQNSNKTQPNPRKVVKFVSEDFNVLEVKGTIEYRTPLGLTWRNLKRGDRLLIGTYLSIPEGSKLKLQYYLKNRGKFRAEETSINFNYPLNIRLTHEVLRRIVLEEYFMSRLPMSKSKNKNPKSELSLLDQAWTRVEVLFHRNKDNERQIEQILQDSPQKVEIGLRHKEISIIYPRNGAVLWLPEYPAMLNIIWVKPTMADLKYKVYVWQSEHDFSKPTLETSADNAQIQIAKPGAYYVMIRDASGKYSSYPHLVYLEKDLPDVALSSEKSSDEKVTLKYPEEGFLLLSTSKSKITFNWKIAESLKLKNLSLNILDVKNKKTRQISVKTQGSEAAYTFNPGHYLWWISFAVNDPQGKNSEVIDSERRQFMIVNTKDSFAFTKKLLSQYVDEFVSEDRQYKILIKKGI